jgi:hypothetical protein
MIGQPHFCRYCEKALKFVMIKPQDRGFNIRTGERRTETTKTVLRCPNAFGEHPIIHDQYFRYLGLWWKDDYDAGSL